MRKDLGQRTGIPIYFDFTVNLLLYLSSSAPAFPCGDAILSLKKLLLSFLCT